MTKGFKSTEFWIGVAFMVASFGIAIYGIRNNSDLLGIAAIIGAIASNSTMYIYGRSRVKVSEKNNV